MKHIPTFEDFLNESTVKEMAVNDVNVQTILRAFDAGDLKEKRRISDIISGSAHTDRKKLIADLTPIGYEELMDIMDELGMNESAITEGTMSRLDLMARESKTLDAFIKKVKSEYPDLMKMEGAEEWLEKIYQTA